MKIIDEQLISGVVEQAKQSPRLRMNYNFHESLQDKCHRFLNAFLDELRGQNLTFEIADRHPLQLAPIAALT